MSDHEYEMRERMEFNRSLREADEGSLAERKEACAEFLDAMKNHPETVGERVGWLIDGNYGYGAHKVAREVVANPRMNRRAWLTHTVAALEWKCPGKMSVASWKKLTPAEKAALDAAVDREIASYEAEHGIVPKAKSRKHRYGA